MARILAHEESLLGQGWKPAAYCKQGRQAFETWLANSLLGGIAQRAHLFAADLSGKALDTECKASGLQALGLLMASPWPIPEVLDLLSYPGRLVLPASS